VDVLLVIFDSVVVEGLGVAIAPVAQARVPLAGNKISLQWLLAIPALNVGGLLGEMERLLHLVLLSIVKDDQFLHIHLWHPWATIGYQLQVLKFSLLYNFLSKGKDDRAYLSLDLDTYIAGIVPDPFQSEVLQVGHKTGEGFGLFHPGEIG
jgi:hypothetical protein